MKQVTMARPVRAASRKRGLVQRWARRLVLRQLRELRGGRIVLADEYGTERLGKGSGPVARIRVARQDFYRRVALRGDLGAAESFMQGEWTTDSLTGVLRAFARDQALCRQIDGGWAGLSGRAGRLARRLARNTLDGSRRNVRSHYDLGNSFFELFLDETMNYSAGIFRHPDDSLRDASTEKMERACRKLNLQSQDHLLEIGTGWGGLAVHAASRYGCRVTTATISARQYEFARRRVREAGLGSRVEVLQRDYRELAGRFDKLVSIEMIEAVGDEYLDTYFAKCSRLLKPTGLMLLQAIVTPGYRYRESRDSVDFIRRHIFPGSCLVSVGRMSKSIARATDFATVHLEDIGPHYAETLRRWRRRFLAAADRVRGLGYDERFVRMWDYYLCYCEAGFEERIVGDVQMLLARPANRSESVLGDLKEPVRFEAQTGGTR